MQVQPQSTVREQVFVTSAPAAQLEPTSTEPRLATQQAAAHAAFAKQTDLIAAANLTPLEERGRLKRDKTQEKDKRFRLPRLNDDNCESDWRWKGGELIEALLKHTDLVDLGYLIQLIELGGIVPRWQDLPEVAKINRSNCWRLKTWSTNGLAVLVLSYPWLERAHPDPLGETLTCLLPFFRTMHSEAVTHHPFATVGVLMDYMCLPQKPYRDSSEQERFKCGLKNINQWYVHPNTVVLKVTNTLPSGMDYANTRPYSQRGWCFFESCVSDITKGQRCSFDFAGYKGYYRGYSGAGAEMTTTRQPPMSPDRFAHEMRERVGAGMLAFTAHADMEFVIDQYKIAFVHAFETFRGAYVSYTNLEWTDEQAPQLIEAFEYVKAHCKLNGTLEVELIGNQFSERTHFTNLAGPAVTGYLRPGFCV